MISKILNSFNYDQRGFTLIELLVVVAVLGALAGVAIPNLSRFIGTGETESHETELHNIQTATLALMADQNINQLDAGTYPVTTDDMDDITLNSVQLSDYVTGLNTDGTTASGCTYVFEQNGMVSQGTCP